MPNKPDKKTDVIRDSYETMEQFTEALRSAGLEKCNLLVAIDFTKSNTWQGTTTFSGKCLHFLTSGSGKPLLPTYGSAFSQVTQNPPSAPGGPPAYQSQYQSSGEPENLYEPVKRSNSIARTLSFETKDIDNSRELLKTMNPYQYVLSIAGKQLESFDEDGWIPTCIFGHARNQSDPYIKPISVRPGAHCFKIDEVIEAYENAVQNNGLSGNTQFAPIVEWAMNIVAQTKEYHILLIIGDGCIDDLPQTKELLARAGKLPLSVIFVGVGDGSDPKDPKDKWRSMRDLDDNPTGDVDNWQSVYLANIKDDLDRSQHPDVDLAVQLFMEIPEQYRYFKSKGLIQN